VQTGYHKETTTISDFAILALLRQQLFSLSCESEDERLHCIRRESGESKGLREPSGIAEGLQSLTLKPSGVISSVQPMETHQCWNAALSHVQVVPSRA